MNYVLPYFGNINLCNLKQEYYSIIKISKNNISIGLSFDNKSIDGEIADGMRIFLENIHKQDQYNRDNIAKDFEEKQSQSYAYINFYLTEFDKTELMSILGNPTEKTNIASQLLNQLQLTRITLYPDGKQGVTYYAVFDYTIYLNGLPCDQLLVIFTDQHGNLHNIGWDS